MKKYFITLIVMLLSLNSKANITVFVVPDSIFNLPFLEIWGSDTFNLNTWNPGDNWVIDGQFGNPYPSAKFMGNPALSNYSSSLETNCAFSGLGGSSISDKTWLDFELKLDDQTSSQTEFIDLEVFTLNNWVPVIEFANEGNLDWTFKHIDITAAINNGYFKFRFRVHGENSNNIHGWYVDNIRVYTLEFMEPPLNLMVDVDGIPQKNMYLTWQPPLGSGTKITYIRDDNTAENGWVIPPGNNSWLGNEFVVSDSGNIQSVELLWQVNTGAGNEPLTVDIFNANHALLATSVNFIPVIDEWQTIAMPNVAYSGTFYAMVHWNMLSKKSNYLGSDEDGPNADSNIEWFYDGSTWKHLSEIGYASCVFMIRVSAFINGGKSVVEYGAAPMLSGKIEKPLKIPDHSDVSKKNTYKQTTVDKHLKDNTNDVFGYGIYRCEYLDPVSGGYTQLSDWTKIATVTQNEYWDLGLSDNCYFYRVTALYIAGESTPTPEEMECISLGVNEIPSGNFKIVPNPASAIVNIDLSANVYSCLVIDAMGKILQKKDCNHQSRITLDISTYPEGVYNICFIMPEGTTKSKKLVITR